MAARYVFFNGRWRYLESREADIIQNILFVCFSVAFFAFDKKPFKNNKHNCWTSCTFCSARILNKKMYQLNKYLNPTTTWTLKKKKKKNEKWWFSATFIYQHLLISERIIHLNADKYFKTKNVHLLGEINQSDVNSYKTSVFMNNEMFLKVAFSSFKRILNADLPTRKHVDIRLWKL